MLATEPCRTDVLVETEAALQLTYAHPRGCATPNDVLSAVLHRPLPSEAYRLHMGPA